MCTFLLSLKKGISVRSCSCSLREYWNLVFTILFRMTYRVDFFTLVVVPTPPLRYSGFRLLPWYHGYLFAFIPHPIFVPLPVLPPPATCWLLGFVVVARLLRCLCRGPRPPGLGLCACTALVSTWSCVVLWSFLSRVPGAAPSVLVSWGGRYQRVCAWGLGCAAGLGGVGSGIVTGLRGVAFVGAWISWVVGSARSRRIASFPFYGGCGFGFRDARSALLAYLCGFSLRPFTGLALGRSGGGRGCSGLRPTGAVASRSRWLPCSVRLFLFSYLSSAVLSCPSGSLSFPLSAPPLAFPPRFGWADSRAPLLPPSLLRGPLCVALGLSLSRLPFALPPAVARGLACRLVSSSSAWSARAGLPMAAARPAFSPRPRPVARSARCPRSLALAPGSDLAWPLSGLLVRSASSLWPFRLFGPFGWRGTARC